MKAMRMAAAALSLGFLSGCMSLDTLNAISSGLSTVNDGIAAMPRQASTYEPRVTSVPSAPGPTYRAPTYPLRARQEREDCSAKSGIYRTACLCSNREPPFQNATACPAP